MKRMEGEKMTKKDVIEITTKYDLLLCVSNLILYITCLVLCFTVSKHSEMLWPVFIFSGVGIILNNSYIYICVKFLNNHESDKAKNLNFFCDLLMAVLQIWTALGFVVGLILLGVNYGS